MKKYLFLLVFCVSLFAHPHVFIDVSMSVEGEKVTVIWKFDEMTSTALLLDYDKNKNKKFEPSEVDFLEKDHFKTLEEYSYFVRLFEGKKEAAVKKIVSFDAKIEGKKLVYSFAIPKPVAKNYEFRFYDPDMFVALQFAKNALACEKGVVCRLEGYDADYYYGHKVVVNE